MIQRVCLPICPLLRTETLRTVPAPVPLVANFAVGLVPVASTLKSRRRRSPGRCRQSALRPRPRRTRRSPPGPQRGVRRIESELCRGRSVGGHGYLTGHRKVPVDGHGHRLQPWRGVGGDPREGRRHGRGRRGIRAIPEAPETLDRGATTGVNTTGLPATGGSGEAVNCPYGGVYGNSRSVCMIEACAHAPT